MINYKESEDIMKPKYKVIRWQTDGTEEIWDASQKPTFPEMYKLINCTTIERQRGYDKDISNRTFDMWMDEEGGSMIKGIYHKEDNPKGAIRNERATNASGSATGIPLARSACASFSPKVSGSTPSCNKIAD